MIEAAQGREFQAFCKDIGDRVQAGSHLILYGPRGSGKSTLLSGLGIQFGESGIPCGLARRTCGLPDIVAALAAAYPRTDIAGLCKRAAGARLRRVADRSPGVLLLDHATRMTTAMLGYLRRLRGGIAGAILVADIDSQRERERMRAWHAGALSVRMPLMPNRTLQGFLLATMHSHGIPKIEPRMQRQIVGLARGRIGWAKECARRLQMQEYWRGDRLHLGLICTDTEIAVRQSRSGPSMHCRII
jgi:energy-coupling factor transporter ATP-binding protein EcfA2